MCRTTPTGLARDVPLAAYGEVREPILCTVNPTCRIAGSGRRIGIVPRVSAKGQTAKCDI